MAQQDWFRNAVWNKEVEAFFEAKLARARKSSKPQYLILQAGHLLDTYPLVALSLTERYFETKDDIFIARAYQIQAEAWTELRYYDKAAQSYLLAINQEKLVPSYKTESYVNFPFLVATHSIETYYLEAVRVLNERESDLAFPMHRFKFHAAYALILKAQKNLDEAPFPASHLHHLKVHLRLLLLESLRR